MSGNGTNVTAREVWVGRKTVLAGFVEVGKTIRAGGLGAGVAIQHGLRTAEVAWRVVGASVIVWVKVAGREITFWAGELSWLLT